MSHDERRLVEAIGALLEAFGNEVRRFNVGQAAAAEQAERLLEEINRDERQPIHDR
jgi:hypothetical protein